MGSSVSRSLKRSIYTPTLAPESDPRRDFDVKLRLRWEWEEGHATWRQFSLEENDELNKISHFADGRGVWRARDVMYEGDVYKMTQKNLATDGIRHIRMRPERFEERPELLMWSDGNSSWMPDKDLDLKVLLALRHGMNVEHESLSYSVNFSENCLRSALALFPFAL